MESYMLIPVLLLLFVCFLGDRWEIVAADEASRCPDWAVTQAWPRPQNLQTYRAPADRGRGAFITDLQQTTQQRSRFHPLIHRKLKSSFCYILADLVIGEHKVEIVLRIIEKTMNRIMGLF